MGKVGWILGGLYAVDGLIALVGGRRVMKWADRRFGRRLPSKWAHLLKQGTNVKPGVLTAWGINNLLAGMGMLAVTMLVRRRATAQ